MIRIAITGPESSGKTTLGKALALELSATFVPEFARDFLANLDRAYSQADLTTIAKGQLDVMLSSSAEIQIIDTDFIVLKIWSEEKYASTSIAIEELISKNYFDLHILCTPDIPWESDPLRENPNDRNRLFQLYHESLTKMNKPFIIVNGPHNNRLTKSLSTINAISK
ncbi:MAG: NadR type nicotinamide-nucleotide adenylyltransferase [Flavobacteriaceae bacterium]|jgi:NadR type nicotinamide-nucleotide adenylyltransferase